MSSFELEFILFSMKIKGDIYREKGVLIHIVID